MANGADQPPASLPHARDEWSWAGASLAIAFLALFASSFCSRVRHPPRVFAECWIAGGLAVIATVLALYSSRSRAQRWPVRFVLGFALLLALLALYAPLMSYYESFHDLPWVVLVPILCVLVVGGWPCRQRWLSLFVAGLVAYLAFGALRPPLAGGLPRTTTIGDLSATIVSVGGPGCEFVLTVPAGTQLGEEYDLHNISLEGRTSRVLPLTCWRPIEWPPKQDQLPNQVRMLAWTFPPSWARSVDLTIVVPRWPEEAFLSVSFPVPPPGRESGTPFAATDGRGVRIHGSEVRRCTVDTRAGKVPGISLRVDYEGMGSDGFRRRPGIRAIDDEGRTLHSQTDRVLVEGAVEGARVSAWLRLWPVGDDVRHITIQAFTDGDLDRNLLRFSFERLPNR